MQSIVGLGVPGRELGPEGIDGYLDAMSIAVSPGA
jgi:hypothetical protein